MSRFKLKTLIFICLLAATVALAGCSGDTGPAGATGPAGPAGPAGDAGADGADGADGEDGADGADGEDAADAGLSKLETCSICHKGVSSDKHQSIYDDYADASNLTLTIDNVASTPNGDGTFTVVATFSAALNGAPVTSTSSLEQLRFGWAEYNSTTGTFPRAGYLNDAIAATATPGQYTATENSVPIAPELSNAQVYGYVADTALDIEAGGHIHLYDDVANAGVAFGNANTYVSAANAEGCEKCHGAPYMKHGYRAAAVTNLSDFASCKICHYDTRSGGHEDWQILVDNPVRFAEIYEGDSLTPAEEAKYAYTANIMNDTHMSHGMEFPYPQSMANCATCHEGKLAAVLDNSQFTGTTCKSCHAIDGDPDYDDSHRAPPMRGLWVEQQVESFHNITLNCTVCHDGSVAPVFSAYHTGYDSVIYADAAGTRYSDIFTTTIDSASLIGNTLTIGFSTTAPGGNPTTISLASVDPVLLVGLYGYDTKDYVVGPHRRTVDSNRDLEFGVDDTNPRGTVTATATPGAFTATADLSNWADRIADGSVRRAEIAVTPELPHPTLTTVDRRGNIVPVTIAVNAPSRTFDLVANTFVDGFYGDIVDVTGCNTCHDALATTFHSADRGGNYGVCRLCHTSLDDGSHLEMQSRSTYAHAAHSFQDFDIGDIDFTDPVEAVKHELHIGHTFPNFTIKNCEACHVSTEYEVPDQSFVLPGHISGSDTVTTKDRNIGTVPRYVVGPGSLYCGACHRAQSIKEDAAGALASLNQHTQDNGNLIEVADDTEADSVLEELIEYVMSFFY